MRLFKVGFKTNFQFLLLVMLCRVLVWSLGVSESLLLRLSSCLCDYPFQRRMNEQGMLTAGNLIYIQVVRIMLLSLQIILGLKFHSSDFFLFNPFFPRTLDFYCPDSNIASLKIGSNSEILRKAFRTCHWLLKSKADTTPGFARHACVENHINSGGSFSALAMHKNWEHAQCKYQETRPNKG